MRLRLAGTVVLGVLAVAGLAQAAPPFATLDAAQIRQRCDRAFGKAEAEVRAMEKRRAPTVLEEWNRVQIIAEDIAMPAAVFGSVHPDQAAREAGDACYARGLELATRMAQSGALLGRVRDFRPKNPRQARFRQDLLDRFEDSGATLDARGRDRVKQIQARIELLRQEFFNNANHDSSVVAFTEEEMRGTSAGFRSRLQRDPSGRYLVPMQVPFYGPAIEQLAEPGARERLITGWFRVGGERNVRILDEITALRGELARLLGFRSYAEYVLRRRMTGSPEPVNEFLGRVWSVADKLERDDLARIRAAKAADTGRAPDEVAVVRADVPYYIPKIQAGQHPRERTSIPLPKAIDHLFEVARRLFRVEIVRREGAAWDPDVSCHDVRDAGRAGTVGTFCLDLVEREGKPPGRAFAIHVFGASRIERRRPVSVLIASVGRDALSLGDLESLLHEFGHVMHGVLSETDYVAHSGTRVMMDFVEAPSQMFEEWARDPRALALLHERCPECQGVDAASVERRRAARRFPRGIRVANDWRMATLDMALASDVPESSLETWNRVQSRTAIVDPPGTFRFAATLHLAGGYAAGYYGYPWARAIGEDLLSAFGGNLLDPEVGRRFRRLLAQGAERHPADLVREFLGREPRMEPYFARLRD